MVFQQARGAAEASSRRPAKSWIFTVNNWTPEQLAALEELGAEKEQVSYMVMGREVGANGTPHLQGCVTFRKTLRLGAVSRLIPQAFVERCYALGPAREYCKKDADFVEIDNRDQGKRSDLERVVETLQVSGLRAVIEEHPETYIKFHGGIDKLSAHLAGPRSPLAPPEIWWIYGSTGVGKSRLVHERERDLWVSMASHKWWEGYHQQEAILIDDMRGSYAPFHELLKILDRYPYRAERKGSSVQVKSARIYITSQYPPYKVYNRENRGVEDIKQLTRRITHCFHAQSSFAALPDSPYSFIKHGVLFQKKEQAELLAEDAALHNSASAPGFNFP